MSDREQLLEPILIESDDEIGADRDDRHAHLAALFYHLLALRKIGGDVVLGVLHAVLAEEFLRRLAEVAGRRRVNGDLFCLHTR